MENSMNTIRLKKMVVFLVALTFCLTPATLAAPSSPGEVLQEWGNVPHKQNLLFMVSGYEINENGFVAQCPNPQLFKNGTRTVYSYIPAEATDNVSTIVLWYELDENGNLAKEEPIGVQETVLGGGELFVFDYSFNQGTTGQYAPLLVVQADDGEWYYIAVGWYRLLGPDDEAPQPIACPDYPVFM